MVTKASKIDRCGPGHKQLEVRSRGRWLLISKGTVTDLL